MKRPATASEAGSAVFGAYTIGMRIHRLACSLLLALPASAWAQEAEAPVDEQAVVSQALDGSPTLRAAFLDLRAARAAQRAADGRYLPVFNAALSGSYAKSPVITLGGVSITEGSAVEASVGVSQQLSLGTQMSLTLSGTQNRRTVNPIPTMSTTIQLGPTYATELRATVTQPLLRGAGDDVGGLEARTAERRERAADAQRDYVASDLLRAVLKAYWELSYASAALAEQERSRDLSERQYEEAKRRAELGLLADAEALQLATELASLEEAVAEARGLRRTRAIELGSLLGQAPAQSEDLSAHESPAAFPLPSRDAEAWATRAVERSAELRSLAENAAIAREQVASAEDAALARLDLTGWLSLQGLGDRDALAPLSQMGRGVAPSGFVSLELELPLDNARLRNTAQQARFEADASEARLQEQTLAIQAAVENQLSALRVAERRIELSQHTVELAEALAQAEEKRYALGTTTATTAIIARESVRNARLRMLRAQADKNSAAVDLAHLAGDLLERYSAPSHGVLQ